jgi:hypothetical protein
MDSDTRLALMYPVTDNWNLTKNEHNLPPDVEELRKLAHLHYASERWLRHIADMRHNLEVVPKTEQIQAALVHFDAAEQILEPYMASLEREIDAKTTKRKRG